MSHVAHIMSTDLCTVGPEESLRRAAQLMQQKDLGALPVCQDHQLLGMLTDRDITIRAVAGGLDADGTAVSDVMSEDLCCCTGDQTVEAALQLMGEHQLRRLPVVDAQRRLVGIVALADAATCQVASVDQAVREICEPAS